jgi:hypothetical protein
VVLDSQKLRFYSPLLRTLEVPMRYIALLVLSMCAIHAMASAVVPRIDEIAIKGPLPWTEKQYEISVLLDDEKGRVKEFVVLIDAQKIPIPISQLSKFSEVDLHSLDVILGRDTWTKEDNLYIGAFTILHISFQTSMQCETGFVQANIEIDTRKYSANVSDSCIKEIEDDF